MTMSKLSQWIREFLGRLNPEGPHREQLRKHAH